VIGRGQSGRLDGSRLGLITFARLLDVVEPYRVRWALQHLPYPVAKVVRSLMNPKTPPNAPLALWETQVLRAAWDRLHAEGALGLGFGGSL
jgi:hypothetical protein